MEMTTWQLEANTWDSTAKKRKRSYLNRRRQEKKNLKHKKHIF
jgi:hypothetical protein